MPHIYVKDLKRPQMELVYQGRAVCGCETLLEEDSVMLWAGDPGGREAAVRIFVSAEEARSLAKELLDAATQLQTKK
ncbi:MAG TPA: hypothetical protein PLU47_16635 [Azonexus sp.]|nr:hypothetical protein [Azonexus sp.]